MDSPLGGGPSAAFEDVGHTSLRKISDERRFQVLVEAVTDYAIYLLDADGYVTSWNSGAERIKGYAAAEVLGRHFSLFFTDEDRAEGRPGRALATARQTGRFEDEGWRLRKDGSQFWAMAVLDAVRDDTGTLIGFAKVTRDITEKRKASQALEEAREQLFQSQKLEAVGQLTGGVAHDFNNLLTIILSSAILAERRVSGDDKLKELLGHIKDAAKRGAGLTQHLLAFSRRQTLRPEVLDVSRRLTDMANLLSRSLRGDIALKIDLPANLWPVEVDPGQFELALLNLGLNARDAMPDGGTLTVTGRNIVLDDKVAELVGKYIAVEVADTGCGMPEAIKSRAFEPFFTTKDVGKGSGLGLSQVYGLAKQSGGSVTIDSEEGKGTTVTIYLPAAKAAPAVAAPQEVTRFVTANPRATILVVEDEERVADVTVAVLEQSGYRVRLARHADEALELLRRGERVDLVFTDVVMPGNVDGIQLAQSIRKTYPSLPVLLASGFSDALTAAGVGALSLISKPYEPETLLARIAATIERRPQAIAR
jgi:PAS domain S-box-containing protein